MNSFKIALKNIKKCRRDYSVYFFTLIIGVAIFYMFNSVGTQGLLEDLSRSGNENVQSLIRMTEAVSGGVAIVLGMLVIYANRFLIKRRKKEFGLYMLLGMSKKKVSGILVRETCIVGFVSMLIGLVSGIFGSQLLSIVVAKMFAIDVSKYTFDVSKSAIVITLICFVAIFAVVLIFNAGMVSKYKLIDLLNAAKMNEKQIIHNTGIAIGGFIISLAVLITACVRVGFFGKDLDRNAFVLCIIAGIAGIFGMFAFFAGFFQKLMAGRKKFYAKGLNSFVVRQFSGNMNTSAVSMALISLLLFAALCLFSSGFSIRTYLNGRLGNATPVDVTMNIESNDVERYLEEKQIPLKDWAGEYLTIPVYEGPAVTIADTVAPVMEEARKTFMHANWESRENVIKLSDYNALERMYGRKELKVGEGSYAIVSDFELLNTLLIPALEKGNELTVAGRKLKPAYESVINEFILMSGMSADMGAVIIPDEAVDDPESGFECTSTLVIADYSAASKEEREKTDERLMAALGEINEKTKNGDTAEGEIRVTISEKTEVEKASVGTSVITVFLVLYIGLVFVIACAAIIGLKQMSDALDSAGRFEILARIGAGRNMREKALFAQVIMNFLIPVIVAAFTAFFGLRYIKGLISAVGLVNMTSGVAFTFAVMLLVYGGYFLTTYAGCKKIVMGINT